jgi:hypothetical protein
MIARRAPKRRRTLKGQPVLALTVRPPWSHWIRAGVKLVENRSWAPAHRWRGRLVIHAGKRVDQDAFWYGAIRGHHVDDDDLNIGEYIAVCDLVDVHEPGEACTEACSIWGVPGAAFHWVLSDVKPIVTVEGRGRQRLYIPPPDVIDLALAA